MFLYEDMLKSMNGLSKRASVKSVGKSELGRDLMAIEFGKPVALLVGAIHAREWLTAQLLLELAKANAMRLEPYPIAFLPLSNPDGVELSKVGVKSVDYAPSVQDNIIGEAEREELKRFLISVNGGTNFSLWKANAKAVDLNVNFAARWGEGEQNVFTPSSENYVGERAFSESETRAIADYSQNFSFTLCYHTKGEVVYYGFDDNVKDKKYALELAALLHYNAQTSRGSAGGLKDWLVGEKGLSALTVECGDDNAKHPLSEVYLADLVDKHKIVSKYAFDTATEINGKR